MPEALSPFDASQVRRPERPTSVLPKVAVGAAAVIAAFGAAFLIGRDSDSATPTAPPQKADEMPPPKESTISKGAGLPGLAVSKPDRTPTPTAPTAPEATTPPVTDPTPTPVDPTPIPKDPDPPPDDGDDWTGSG